MTKGDDLRNFYRRFATPVSSIDPKTDFLRFKNRVLAAFYKHLERYLIEHPELLKQFFVRAGTALNPRSQALHLVGVAGRLLKAEPDQFRFLY